MLGQFLSGGSAYGSMRSALVNAKRTKRTERTRLQRKALMHIAASWPLASSEERGQCPPSRVPALRPGLLLQAAAQAVPAHLP